jgi:D-alanyl-D-alanine carboxypeptidase (penicillin-binding protein 5/6)
MNWLKSLALVVVGLLPLSPQTATTLTQATAPTPVISQPPATLVAVPVAVSSDPLSLAVSSAYAVDLTSGQTLYDLHADTQRPIASVTKLATALVIVHRYQPNDIITVPTLPAYAAADSIMGLHAGERLSVHDLLAALLISSSDDAADALGIATSGSQAAFATQMNQMMATWGISNAHFSNPSGLIDAGNGASARALAQIASLALRNPTIKQLVNTPSLTIHDQAGRAFTLATTDDLLNSGAFQGIKTGYTPAAGECFVGLTTIQGHQVITVVLNATDRFGATTQLANWIQHTYQWQQPPL